MARWGVGTGRFRMGDVPERVRQHPAVLSRAGELADGAVRASHRRPGQRRRWEPRRVLHARHLAARGRLPHGAGRQVPQPVSVRPSPVRPRGMGPARREAEPERRDRVPQLPRRRPGVAGVRAGVRDRLARGPGGRVRADRAVQPTVLPPLRAERPASPVDPGRASRGRPRGTRRRGPPNVAGALRGAPPWVRSLPEASAAQRTEWLQDQRRADETLLAVDEALHALVEALGDRLDDTYVFVLSDNGYSFGEHRWEGKKCPYEACVRIPLAVHSPSVDGGERRQRSSRSWTWRPRS